MSKQTELAQIHIAKKALGMEDDAYRYMLNDIAGVSSAADLDLQQRHAVIQRMKDLGWKPARKKYGPKSRNKTVKNQADKMRALWIQMADQGIVKDRSEQALNAFVKRTTKGKYLAAQFCDVATASSIIEKLKQWQKRLAK